MNKSYLIVERHAGVREVSEISKDDLARVRDGMIEAIIDLSDRTYYDRDQNRWMPFNR